MYTSDGISYILLQNTSNARSVDCIPCIEEETWNIFWAMFSFAVSNASRAPLPLTEQNRVFTLHVGHFT